MIIDSDRLVVLPLGFFPWKKIETLEYSLHEQLAWQVASMYGMFTLYCQGSEPSLGPRNA